MTTSNGHPPARRVLVAHPSPDVYGSDRQLLETVDALVEAGWQVDVTLPGDGPLRPLLAERGARVRMVEFPVLRRALLSPSGLLGLAREALPAARKLRMLIRRSAPVAVYVNTTTIPIWIMAARLANVPVVCHVHEAEVSLPRAVRAALAGPLLLAHSVIANSHVTRDVIVGAVPPLARRVIVVHNGVPDAGGPTALRTRTASDPIRLVLVSRLSPRKGIDVALEAVATLRGQGRDVTLDVCGTPFIGYEWYERDLRERAGRDDLDGAVVFHGYVHPTRPLLEAADVVLVPSFGESFGNAAVEGLLAGRPVVASRAQGLAEIIRDGRTGVLVAPGSPEELADAISAVADDAAMARRLARAGRRDALSRFSVAQYRAHITALLQTFLEGNGSAPPAGQAGQAGDVAAPPQYCNGDLTGAARQQQRAQRTSPGRLAVRTSARRSSRGAPSQGRAARDGR